MPNKKTQARVNGPQRQPLATAAFLDEPEWRYFRYFHDHMIGTLSGPLDVDLWLKSIPQAGEIHLWLRDTMIAIGALGFGRRRQNGHQIMATDKMPNQHEFYAMEKYGRALRDMQTAIEDRLVDKREVLFICVLVFCFEALQGRQQLACQNAVNGLRAMSRLQTEGKNSRRRSNIPRWSQHWESTIEDDVAVAEYCLEDQLAQFLDIRSEQEHQQQLQSLSHVNCDNMPAQFASIREAVRFGAVIIRRNGHFASMVRAHFTRSAPFAEDVDDTEDLRADRNNWSGLENNGAKNVPTTFVEQQARYRLDVLRFRAATSTVFAEQIVKEFDSRPKVQTSSDHYLYHNLQMIIACTELQTIGCLFPSNMIWDNYRSLFREIIRSAPHVMRYLVHPAQNSFTFHFMVSLLTPLAAVVYWCRLQPERDQALEMMKQIYNDAPDYKEGVWDVKSIYPQCAWVRDVEEAERDPTSGIIPEAKRTTFAGVDINIAEKKVTWKLLQGVGESKRLITRDLSW